MPTNFGSLPSFRLSVPRCPKCGEFPRGMPVLIEGTAQMYTNNDGKTFSYNGHVERGPIREPKSDTEGQATLVCGGLHRWKSAVTFNE